VAKTKASPSGHRDCGTGLSALKKRLESKSARGHTCRNVSRATKELHEKPMGQKVPTRNKEHSCGRPAAGKSSMQGSISAYDQLPVSRGSFTDNSGCPNHGLNCGGKEIWSRLEPPSAISLRCCKLKEESGRALEVDEVSGRGQEPRLRRRLRP